MDAVGDGVDRVAREHVAGDLAVPHGHAVHVVGGAQCHVGEVHCVLLAHPLEPGHVALAQHVRHQLQREAIVSRGNRRVGGEHAVLLDPTEGLGQPRLRIPGAHQLVEERQGGQGGVAFVQVEAVDIVVAERPEHPDAAHPEDDLLTEAVAIVASVEVVGQVTVLLGVFL